MEITSEKTAAFFLFFYFLQSQRSIELFRLGSATRGHLIQHCSKQVSLDCVAQVLVKPDPTGRWFLSINIT